MLEVLTVKMTSMMISCHAFFYHHILFIKTHLNSYGLFLGVFILDLGGECSPCANVAHSLLVNLL